MSSYRILNHTADIGVIVSGKSKKELFAQAAAAMLDLIIERKSTTVSLPPGIGAGKAEEIAGNYLQMRTLITEGNDQEDLLINFLREVLYLFNGERWVAAICRPTGLTGRRIVAELQGEPYDPQKHQVKTEIKAVTYHGLSIRKTIRGWNAEVIFDV